MRKRSARCCRSSSPATALAVSLVLCAMPAPAFSQQPGDPMSPPAARSTDTANPSAAVRPSPPSAAGLQGVLVGPGRRLALVDGDIVPAGAKINAERKILDIGVDSATVQENGARATLQMFPNIEKKPSR
jgi:hypothetical protein